MAQLLDFEQAALNDLLEGDALCVTAAGLSWHKLVSVLIRLNSSGQPGVVLAIGTSPWQRELVCAELKRQEPSLEAPVDINNELSATDRIELYRTRACCFVTTRILVVDLLAARVLPEQVAGIIVLNAQRVSDSSGEGFAVRLYRQGNTAGFVRAFSDQPTAFTAGFARVEKVMKALRVRKLSLWPRFQQQVQVSRRALAGRRRCTGHGLQPPLRPAHTWPAGAASPSCLPHAGGAVPAAHQR
jgi:DNA excision repair protein ERCC-4